MNVLLLCAGFGSRLKPVTGILPKCLVPIAGRPLLDIWLTNLSDLGSDQVFINVHHHSDLVLKFLEASCWIDKVSVIFEDELCGTAGTMLANPSLFEDGSLLVAHADNFTNLNIRRFLSSHKTRPEFCLASMVTFRSQAPSSCGIVELDRNDVVVKFHEKVKNPPSNLANGAIYVFEPELIEVLKSIGAPPMDISLDLIPLLLGRISTFWHAGYHIDVGTINNWTMANKKLSSQKRINDDLYRHVWSRMFGENSQEILSKIESYMSS